ncbi:MAG TPA: hypothetical protein VHH53_01305 [Pseudonocardiaceae bacterium]|nr:hypothetical protein [Pseudonocardiaceae bacterium]
MKNDASCSRRPDTATRNMARAIPDSVERLVAGANTRELMECMGHNSPAVALRYQHVMAGRAGPSPPLWTSSSKPPPASFRSARPRA